MVKPDRFILNNVKTGNDAVWFLKYLLFMGYKTADGIMNRLCYLFSLEIPNDKYLANISLDRKNNNQEYAVMTIWTCANLTIIEDENNKKREREKERLNLL